MASSSTSISHIAHQPGSIRSLFLVCLLLLAGSVMTSGWHVAFKAEHGALELASFVCLSLAAIVSLSFWRTGTIQLWPVPFVFALLALREMDFQNWWFDPGLLRTEIFSAPVPVWHKAVSGIVMVAIIVTLLSLLIKGARSFWRGVFAFECWAVCLMLCGGCVFAALIFDGAEKNFASVGITLSPFLAKAASYGEEIVEFAFAFLLVSSVILFARRVQ